MPRIRQYGKRYPFHFRTNRIYLPIYLPNQDYEKNSVCNICISYDFTNFAH